jgi:hypothetical protein
VLGCAVRHLRGLEGRARESGLAVVLATQGPSDLEAVDRALLAQVLQDPAWQLGFRQGSPQEEGGEQAASPARSELVNPGETGGRGNYRVGETSTDLLIQAGPGSGGTGAWRTKCSG